jgi:hypothetical protein
MDILNLFHQLHSLQTECALCQDPGIEPFDCGMQSVHLRDILAVFVQSHSHQMAGILCLDLGIAPFNYGMQSVVPISIHLRDILTG